MAVFGFLCMAIGVVAGLGRWGFVLYALYEITRTSVAFWHIIWTNTLGFGIFWLIAVFFVHFGDFILKEHYMTDTERSMQNLRYTLRNRRKSRK